MIEAGWAPLARRLSFSFSVDALRPLAARDPNPDAHPSLRIRQHRRQSRRADVASVQSLPGVLAVVVERIARLDGVETLDDVTLVALYFFALRYDPTALRSLT